MTQKCTSTALQKKKKKGLMGAKWVRGNFLQRSVKTEARHRSRGEYKN